MILNNLTQAIRTLEDQYAERKTILEHEIVELYKKRDVAYGDIKEQRRGKTIVSTETTRMLPKLDDLVCNIAILKKLLQQETLDYIKVTDTQSSIIAHFKEEVNEIEKKVIDIKSQEVELKKIKNTYDDMKRKINTGKDELSVLLGKIATYKTQHTLRIDELAIRQKLLNSQDSHLQAREKIIEKKARKLERKEGLLKKFEQKLFAQKHTT